MLLILPEVLTPDELGQAQHWLKQGAWTGGRHTAGQQAAQVKDNEQLDPQHPLTQQLQQLVLGAM
ncbi:MAG: PKHD-type hydroxylase, partial [Inhella sp.]